MVVRVDARSDVPPKPMHTSNRRSRCPSGWPRDKDAILTDPPIVRGTTAAGAAPTDRDCRIRQRRDPNQRGTSTCQRTISDDNGRTPVHFEVSPCKSAAPNATRDRLCQRRKAVGHRMPVLRQQLQPAGTAETIPYEAGTKTIATLSWWSRSVSHLWIRVESARHRTGPHGGIEDPAKGQLDPDETEQFLREARAAAQLRHPNIVSCTRWGEIRTPCSSSAISSRG